ncbi:MAG: hypothetical protein ACXV8Q_00220 [Methylobacter sp.]
MKMKKSLKEQNRWQIWLIISANVLLLYGVIQENTINASGLAAIADSRNILPVGIALAISTVLNGLLDANTKARLVFLRWNHALPGHRVFSKYAKLDPRIDMDKLKKLHGSELPTDPTQENEVWYGMYKSVQNTPTVSQVHRDFLLLRDYTGLAVIFLIVLGSIGVYAIESMDTALLYLGILILQFSIVRLSASNYGIRFVTTALAEKIHSS